MYKTKIFDQPLMSANWALFILRVALGALVFINHGIEKLFTFNSMLEIFPDPIGIGKFPSLIFALISDGICSVLMVLGLFTRISAFLLCINLLAAFVLFHNFQITDVHGELVAIYFVITIIVLFYGPGKISVDTFLKNRFR